MSMTFSFNVTRQGHSIKIACAFLDLDNGYNLVQIGRVVFELAR